MRIAKLLVLSALCLFGYNAKADVPEGIWTMPEPQGLEFTEFTDDETHYILYNPATKMFFASGNGWNTMASLRTFGMELWLQGATESDAPEGSYELWDYNVNNPERQTNTGNIFTDDGNASWVDHGTQGNYSWAYEIVDGCVRFQNVALIADKPEFAGMYLGFDGTYVLTDNTANSGDHRNAYTAILRHVDPSKEGASVDFKAVTVESYEAFIEDKEAYNAYVEGAKTYIASLGLKKAIEDAEALNIDAAAALAVYTNTASTVDEMVKAQAALNEIIDAKTKLKAAIEDYEAKGFTGTADAKAVLNNAQATKAEIEKAHTDLDAAFIEWGSNQASVANPVDMSSKIVNPHFDNADATTGWSGDAFGRGGAVSDGAEHYSKNYNTYQKITGLTPGVYAIGVYGFYRAGNYDGGVAVDHWLANDEASKYAKLYGQVGESYREVPIVSPFSGAQAENQNQGDVESTYQDADGNDVTVYVPNTMVAGDYYIHTLNQYANTLFVSVDESGELTIGVKKTSQIGGDWSFFDDFSLTYYGKGADAYQMMLDEALKNYGEVTIDEGTVYTEALLDAYKAALAGEKTATSQAEVDAIFNKIDGTYNELLKNIELWKQYKQLVEESHAKYCVDQQFSIYESAGILADYIDSDLKEEGEDGYETIYGEHSLTNEELEAEIAFVQSLCDAVEKDAKEGLKPGDDVTRFLKNPDFEGGVKRGVADPNGHTGDYGTAVGWHADKFANGNFTPGPDGKDNDPTVNHAFEAWHCWDFDLWQEVENAPEGVYVIDVQGYVRNETGPNGSTVTEYDPSIIPIKLYMNNSTSNFPDVFSEEVAEEHYLEDGTLPKIEDHSWNGAIENYPNSMGAAGMCFDWGMYKVHTYGLVKAGDKMRIGVKGKMNGHWWCIWDNFKLTYQGYEVEYVQPALEEAMKNIDVTKPMGKNVYATAKGLADKAEEAKKTGDGKTMFQMLADVYDASAAIISSVQLFATLTDAIENEETGLNSAIFTSSNEEAKAEAQTLVGTITSGIQDYDINDDEVAGLLEQIEKMKTKLRLPGGLDTASDSNPIDVTSVIMSADFGDEIGDNTIAGWTTSGGKFGENDYLWVLAYESWQSKFSINQDFIGLPAGTYEVTVSGFCRNGDNQQDYDSYQENPAFSLAYVYAINGDSAVNTVPMAAMASYGLTDESIDGVTEFIPTGSETTYYIPGNLAAAKDMMTADVAKKWVNTVVVKVLEDGKLSIGIKKDSDLTNSWVVIDDWKLTYFGANSSKEASGDGATAISIVENEPVNVEFFTLDGRKATRAQKGVIIQKTTLGNGATIIKKIMK